MHRRKLLDNEQNEMNAKQLFVTVGGVLYTLDFTQQVNISIPAGEITRVVATLVDNSQVVVIPVGSLNPPFPGIDPVVEKDVIHASGLKEVWVKKV